MNRLSEALSEYSKTDCYPLHMPGHKRVPDNWKTDITEISGFDDLHDPSGLILEMEQQAKGLYGSDESFLLVNGSTCGILSAISACCPHGSSVLMARNCHRSVYHAAWILGLTTYYLAPPLLEEYGICGGIDPDEVEDALNRHPECKVVVITSPTYEGVISDIAKIADIVHKANAVLIVDEAHGAHLKLVGQFFPEMGMVSSLDLGADIVIQSLHKTLPSPTQTAILHTKGNRISPSLIRDYLRVYQTSSPSYVLMAGIGDCLNLMEASGFKYASEYAKKIRDFYKKTEQLKYLRILSRSGKMAGFDIGKVVIFVPNTDTLDGTWLFETLRDEYHLECEMKAGDYVIAMTTICDTDEGFLRLSNALLELDRRVGEEMAGCTVKRKIVTAASIPQSAMTIAEGLSGEKEEIPVSQVKGRISAEFLYAYPPGIPVIAPGEIFSDAILDQLENLKNNRISLFGRGEKQWERSSTFWVKAAREKIPSTEES